MGNYPGNWSSIRRKVLHRDSYTCGNCNRTGKKFDSVELHVHHIVPKSKGGTNSLSNLRSLCSKCHKSIHGNSQAPTPEDDDSTNSPKSNQKRQQVIKMDDLRAFLSNDPNEALKQAKSLKSQFKLSRKQHKRIKAEIEEELR